MAGRVKTKKSGRDPHKQITSVQVSKIFKATKKLENRHLLFSELTSLFKVLQNCWCFVFIFVFQREQKREQRINRKGSRASSIYIWTSQPSELELLVPSEAGATLGDSKYDLGKQMRTLMLQTTT